MFPVDVFFVLIPTMKACASRSINLLICLMQDKRFTKIKQDKRFKPITKRRDQQPLRPEYQQLLQPAQGHASSDAHMLKQHVQAQAQPEQHDIRAWMQNYAEESSSLEDEPLVLGEQLMERREEQPLISAATSRLAVKNLDWNYIGCSDVFQLANSFKGSGVVKSVSKYLSQFGRERLEHEEQHGPKWEYPGLEPENALRMYERDRLKYYFFIVELDSPATAESIYTACDGMEFEKSMATIDLSYVPDGLTLPAPVEKINSAVQGSSKDFTSRAAGHSKVNLTWDEEDETRKRALTREWSKLTDAQLKTVNWKQYIDLSDEEGDLFEEDSPEGDDTRFGGKSWGKKEEINIRFEGGLEHVPMVAKQNRKSFREKIRDKKQARKVATRDQLNLLVNEDEKDRPFEANLEDSRFSRIYTDPKYAINPNDNAFDPKVAGQFFQKQLKGKSHKQ